MNFKDLRQTADGVYLLPALIARQMPCWPTELPDNPFYCVFEEKDNVNRAINMIIGFSTGNNAWCGASWHKIRERTMSIANSSHRFEELAKVKKGIDEMIETGLLEMAEHRGLRGWFLRLFPTLQIICPTKLLVAKILERQMSLRPLKS